MTLNTGLVLLNFWLNKQCFLWCFTGWNHTGYWFSLLQVCHSLTRGQPCSPSVWLLQESIKRRIWCCVSQGRDPCSALWQRQALCWGLTYTLWTVVKKKDQKKLSAWSVTPKWLMNWLYKQTSLLHAGKIQPDTYCTRQLRKIYIKPKHFSPKDKYSNTKTHLAQCCYLYNMCLWILTWNQFFFSPTDLISSG